MRVLLALQAALLKYAEDAVAESRALRSSRPGASKKELFDSVRKELECAPCLRCLEVGVEAEEEGGVLLAYIFSARFARGRSSNKILALSK